MKKTYLLLVVLVFICCDKSEDIVVLPSVVTQKSVTSSSGGVTLYADFQNFSSQDELRFLISNNSNPAINIILENPKVGQNSIILTSGLYLDSEYKYLAYIKTSTDVYYGLEESFLSTGSKDVSFSNITPNKGNYYDVVELLSNEELPVGNTNSIKVLFNNYEARITKLESKKITCEVPYFDKSIISDIKIKYFGKILNTALHFELATPKIQSVSKREVTFNDEVIINGENFETGNNTNVKVLIDNIVANITQKTKTELTVKIPNGVTSIAPKIKVISNLQETTASDLLVMKLPQINSYPLQANVFDEIVLIGENFNPEAYKNKVYFDDGEAYVISGDSNKLRVKVPHGVFSNWQPSIKIVVSDELKTTTYPISILDASIEIKKGFDIPMQDYQVINNQIYVYGYDPYRPSELVIHKYSVENNTFFDKRIVDLPFQGSTTIVRANGEYIYLYFNRDTQDFYRVNLVNGNLYKLTDFPGEPRNISQVAVYNGNIFIGGGSTGGLYTNINYGDFYEYNVVNNTWLQVPDLVANINTTKLYYNMYTDNVAFMLTGTAGNSQEIYKFDGNRFNNLNKTIQYPYLDFIGRRYFFKNNIFYIVEDNPAGYKINKFRTYNTLNGIWGEILEIFPSDYTIIGMFQHENFVYYQTIDYFLERHLIKLDLNKL